MEGSPQLDCIRRTLKKTVLYYFNERDAHNVLLYAHGKGVPNDVLWEIAQRSTSWTKFKNAILRAIENV